jgi:hypothetical protein
MAVGGCQIASAEATHVFRFFTFFAEPIPGFEDAAIEVIAAGPVEGVRPRDVRRSARLLQAYELDFWLAASTSPGSRLPVVFERPR